MKTYGLIKPKKVIKLIGLWPPYLGAGIRVEHVSEDLMAIKVSMKQRFFNTNYVGTHFGGSLYSMCDPFYMFMLFHHLGRDFIVWDKAASIEFVKPGRGAVYVTFTVDSDLVENIRQKTLKQFKVEPEFRIDVVDSSGEVVAKVYKKLYVRRKDAKERFKEQGSGAP